MVQFLIALVVVGGVLFMIQRIEWIDDTIKLIIKVVLVVFILIYAIRVLLPMSGLS